jgi:hypothetical protein
MDVVVDAGSVELETAGVSDEEVKISVVSEVEDEAVELGFAVTVGK